MKSNSKTEKTNQIPKSKQIKIKNIILWEININLEANHIIKKDHNKAIIQ